MRSNSSFKLPKAICHLNIVGFKAAVAAVKDKSLNGRPFIIAGAMGGRSLALDCSPEAVRQGVTPGMILAAAKRRVRDLIILSPDPSAYELMNSEIEKVADQYAPVWENDRTGNLYLDITGTTSIFGTSADCSSRILRDILEKVNICPAAAVACNKLVSKVATRTIRPTGLIQVHADTEAEFLSHQNINLLPGMGQKLLRTAAITGIKEIGELAALSVTQALALFGKQGAILRNMALGIDGSPVNSRNGARRIVQQADFETDTIEENVIKGGIEALVGYAGLQMRNEKLGMRNVRLGVVFSDGVEVQGCEKSKRLLVTDREIMTAAYGVYKKTVNRRIRIRSIFLCLEDFLPLGYQPDLFEPEVYVKDQKLQEAVDKIQNRYGIGKITKVLVLAAKGSRSQEAGSRNEY